MVQENGVPVGTKRYPPEFKADAVVLYRSRPGVTVASVAADLGVNTESQRSWIRAADPDTVVHPASARPAPAETAVEAENRELRRQVAELKQEREILRRAAKYFAGETNW